MKKTLEDKHKKTVKTALLKAAKMFGGIIKLSSTLETSTTSISNWGNAGIPMSFKHAFAIAELTKGAVEVHQLRPDFSNQLRRYVKRVSTKNNKV